MAKHKGKGGYRSMKASLGGSGSASYNHGKSMKLGGGKSGGNVVSTRLPGGGSPRKGKGKRTGGKSYGMAY